MIWINYGMKESGPGLRVYIWRFIFIIHYNTKRNLGEFIKEVFSEIVEPKLAKGQECRYVPFGLHFNATSHYFTMEVFAFSLFINFGVHDLKYNNFFKINKEE